MAAGQAMLPAPEGAAILGPSHFVDARLADDQASAATAPLAPHATGHAKPGAALGNAAHAAWVGLGLNGSEGGSDYEGAISEGEAFGASSLGDLRMETTTPHGQIQRSMSEGTAGNTARQRSRGSRSRQRLPLPAAEWKPPSSFQGGAVVMSARVDLNDLQYVGECPRCAAPSW